MGTDSHELMASAEKIRNQLPKLTRKILMDEEQPHSLLLA